MLGGALHFEVTAEGGCATCSSCCRHSSAPLSISKLPTNKKKITIFTSLPCFASNNFPAPLPIRLEAVQCCCHPLSKQEVPAVPHLPVSEVELHLYCTTKHSSALRESWQSCENRTGRTKLWQTWQELLKSQQKNLIASMAIRLYKSWVFFTPTASGCWCQIFVVPFCQLADNNMPFSFWKWRYVMLPHFILMGEIHTTYISKPAWAGCLA